MVSKWLGVKGLSESGSLMESTVKGRLLTIASASQKNVLEDSSSSWALLASNIADRSLRTVRICRSQLLSMSVALGTFVINTIQSQQFFSIFDVIFSWSSSVKASLSSPLAPMKLVPWSLLNCRIGPLLHRKRRRALMKESVLRLCEICHCIALDARQVKSTSYLFTPSFFL